MPNHTLSIQHPAEKPAWLAEWLSRPELSALFSNQVVRRLGLDCINRTHPLKLTWTENSLQAVLSPQVVTWRLANGKWSRTCSCGSPNDCCPHAFAAAWLFCETCRQENWLPSPRPVARNNSFFIGQGAGQNSPGQSVNSPQIRTVSPGWTGSQSIQPGLNGSSSRPPLPAGDLFAGVRNAPRRQVRLEVEADFKHMTGKVGMRFYLLEGDMRKILTLNSLNSLGREYADQRENSIREWPKADGQFLVWLLQFIRKYSVRDWTLKMMVLDDEEFQRWRQKWSDVPGRFLDRATQAPLPAPGQTVPVMQYAELVDEGEWIKVCIGFEFAGGVRKQAHEIFQQLSDDPAGNYTRRELMKFSPPVSWSILSQFFSRKSPRMPRNMVETHLAKLLDGRVDIIADGPCVKKHFSQPNHLTVNCHEEDGKFHLNCQVDGHLANLEANSLFSTQVKVREIDHVFHIEFRSGGELCRKLQETLQKFGNSCGKITGQEIIVEATVQNAIRLREFWLSLPDGVERGASRKLAGFLSAECARLTAGVTVRDDNGLVDIALNWQVGNEEIGDHEVRRFLNGGVPVFRGHDGSWFSLALDQIKETAEELHREKCQLGNYETMSRREARERLREITANQKFAIIPSSRRFSEQLLTEPLPELPAIPAELTGILRQYQRTGVDFLNDRLLCGLGSILADDMGLGKTLQVLTVLWTWRQKLRGRQEEFQALVVCPATVISTWLEQSARFIPEFKVKALIGTPRQREKILSEEGNELLVTHYGLLRSEYEKLNLHEFDFVVLDEAQNIKNPEAAVSQAAKGLKASHRLALTGTPLENRPLDLWSIMDFLNPGYLGDSQHFVSVYEFGGQLQRLHGRLKPLMLRRTKHAVAPELPPRMVEVMYCELAPGQRELYDSVLKDAKANLGGEAMEILAALTRLRQVCCDPGLLLKHNHEEGSGKLEVLLEQLDGLVEAGHSVLVFSAFASMLDIIAGKLRERQIAYRQITGNTPLEERSRLVREFSDSENPEVFLLSLKAAGTGLTLTKADYVFNFDPWWNPAAENQAIDRTHRLGQTKPVTAYKLIARNTIEERVLALMEQKKAIFEQVVGQSDDSQTMPTRLTREDLLDLLK